MRGWTFAQNEYGRLDHVSGQGANSAYVGTCRVPGGREQTRKMRGDRESVKKRWLDWQKAVIEQDERMEMAKSTEEAKTAPAAGQAPQVAKIYVLRFASGRNSKNVLAFADQEKALATACALEPALDIAGVDGEYTVDEVQFQ